MADGSFEKIIEVQDLNTVFRTRDGDVHAVNGVDFSLVPGELLGVVGESGSGKSVTMMSMMGILPTPPAHVTSTGILYKGRDISRLSNEEMRRLRGPEIGMIFQDPMTSLNPVFSVGFQIMEPLREHRGMTSKQARIRAGELLELVGIPNGAARLNDYPHQFSGGMRQRVMIAMALACQPALLIADEPTTALDVTIQAQIIELVRDLRREFGMAIVWITHDLGVVAGIADNVAVMYGGRIVEYAPTRELFANPRHPYTRALLDTLPRIDARQAERLSSIEGYPPNLSEKPSSCAFAPRCKHVHDRCLAECPELVAINAGGSHKSGDIDRSGKSGVSETHKVACWWKPGGGK